MNPENPLFASRTALVTGGSRGIGKAVCLMLAANGARVAINYRENEVAAQEVLTSVRSHRVDGMIAQADVAVPEDVEQMVRRVERELGEVDLLVNNAGISSSVSHHDLDFATWKRNFAVNIDGPFLTTWAVKDAMIRRKFGRIVNVSSLASFVFKKEMIHYATAKAAVIAFTRHCSRALAPHVRVNCVAPGLTRTELAESSNPSIEDLIDATPLRRMAEPEEIAGVVRFLLSEESSFVTGQTVLACGGRA